jgi:predicted nucleotidyltransferase
MVQKSDNITFEIILNLLANSENHVRGLAKDLNASHTTILRKVSELVEKGVLDCSREGKNKMLSLKKNFGARNYVYMAENYKTARVISRYPELGVIMKEVSDNADSELIVLFGSYAAFRAKKDSDIDVYIEATVKVKERLKIVSDRLSVKTGVFDLKNNLIREIIKNHVIIKGVEKFYEKTGFFE